MTQGDTIYAIINNLFFVIRFIVYVASPILLWAILKELQSFHNWIKEDEDVENIGHN